MWNRQRRLARNCVRLISSTRLNALISFQPRGTTPVGRTSPLAIEDDLMENPGSGPLEAWQPPMIGEFHASEISFGRRSNGAFDASRMRNKRRWQYNLRTAARHGPKLRQRCYRLR